MHELERTDSEPSSPQEQIPRIGYYLSCQPPVCASEGASMRRRLLHIAGILDARVNGLTGSMSLVVSGPDVLADAVSTLTGAGWKVLEARRTK